MASVVSMRAAIEEAYWSADRVTLVGSVKRERSISRAPPSGLAPNSDLKVFLKSRESGKGKEMSKVVDVINHPCCQIGQIQ